MHLDVNSKKRNCIYKLDCVVPTGYYSIITGLVYQSRYAMQENGFY